MPIDNDLKKVWVAGRYRIFIDKDQNVDYESVTSKILSLRQVSVNTSSILMSGVARVYEKEVDQLLEDCRKLDQSIVMKDKKSE
ncbi:unnamed protein product [Colias eurytheme]|nr:unnamed protein product [Colias eurytheme]